MAGDVRLGVIVPSVNTVVENWYPKIVPDGVSAVLLHDGVMRLNASRTPQLRGARTRQHW
jgi:maleate cis-trans isomerase